MWSVVVVICCIVTLMEIGPAECMAAGRVRRDTNNETVCGPFAYYRRPTGILTNYGYPNPYLPFSDCYYDMRVPSGTTFSLYLKFCEIDLECGSGPGAARIETSGRYTTYDHKVLCSTPAEQTFTMWNETENEHPTIRFVSSGQGSGRGFKIAYCFEDFGPYVALPCSQRSDFTCDMTNYDYIRYQDRGLSGHYNWSEVRREQQPLHPAPTESVTPLGSTTPWGSATTEAFTTLGESVTLGESRNSTISTSVSGKADVEQLVQDLINVYFNVRNDVQESWNAQNAAVYGLIHALDAANANRN